MSRKNLNRRHLNFLARQALARERRFRAATRTLQRRAHEAAEARRVSARRTEAIRRSAATTRCDQPSPPLNGQTSRDVSAPLPTPLATPLPSAAQPPEIQTAQNLALRPHISETVRQFLMTLSIKRADKRDAGYIAVWNAALPGLSLTSDLLEVYRTTPPDREALVDLIIDYHASEDGQSNRGNAL